MTNVYTDHLTINVLETVMAGTAVILIRVALGLTLGFLGMIAFAQGLYTTLSVDFPSWDMAAMVLAALTVGSALMYGAWRIMSATLRLPAQTTS